MSNSNDIPTDGIHFNLHPIIRNKIDGMRKRYSFLKNQSDDQIMIDAFKIFNEAFPELKPLVDEMFSEMAKEGLEEMKKRENGI